jgi:hypothetical protein
VIGAQEPDFPDPRAEAAGVILRFLGSFAVVRWRD